MLHHDFLAVALVSADRDRRRRRSLGTYHLSRRTKNCGDNARVACCTSVVAHFAEYGERGFAGPKLRFHECSPLRYVQWVRFHQPRMAIDSSALVKPAIALGGIVSHE